MSRGMNAFLIEALVIVAAIALISFFSMREVGPLGISGPRTIENPADSQAIVSQPEPPAKQREITTWRDMANERAGSFH